ncbi:hypothetical protein PM082_004533 [Marasmius tenuissimus]|nr:hypothetical protein PM082_004533 [Marasmius tenuissimus]
MVDRGADLTIAHAMFSVLDTPLIVGISPGIPVCRESKYVAFNLYFSLPCLQSSRISDEGQRQGNHVRARFSISSSIEEV